MTEHVAAYLTDFLFTQEELQDIADAAREHGLDVVELVHSAVMDRVAA